MVANPKMFQLMYLARNKNIERELFFLGKTIRSLNTGVELLGVRLLNFKSHIENICCKENVKIRVLFRVRNFLTLKLAKVLAHAYIYYQTLPMFWMFCGKCSNNLITKTHYRCLRAIYNTQIETYHNLLHINGKTDMHTQNIQLSVKIWRCLNKFPYLGLL